MRPWGKLALAGSRANACCPRSQHRELLLSFFQDLSFVLAGQPLRSVLIDLALFRLGALRSKAYLLNQA